MFGKILVAIDHSDMSEFIFNEALTLAKANHASLMLVHVIAPFDDTYPGDPYIRTPKSVTQIYLERWKEREQEGLEKLRVLQQLAERSMDDSTAAGVSVEFTQNIGDPGRMICALARNWNADLIVVGRRGLNALREFFLGSVSNYVLHHAPCHVLTIQAKSQIQNAQPTEATAANS
jgi:nucleotide-binding universal stress UspA family protein